MRRSRVVCFVLVLLVTQALGDPASCPSVCVCKWKGGKQTVECKGHGLIRIPENINSETQVLDMSGNNLQVLQDDMFSSANLINLQKVYLKNCHIGQINNNAFRGLTNLVELDLSHNLITSIPSMTFNDVRFLRDVTLAYNPIQKIETHTFRTLPSLVKLDLSHCRIDKIEPRAFEGVEQLESLKLNGNYLTELQPKTLESLSRLHGIEIHDNPWVCDCRLRPMKVWLAEYNIPYPVAPLCGGGPPRILNSNFAETDVDDFACRPEVLHSSRYIEAISGENASVTCKIGAVPGATVNWFANGRMLLNNSALSSHQRIQIIENGDHEKESTLLVLNAQEADSSEFYCVAENRAGHAEANFTLHVSLRAAGVATLGSGQIVGLSAAFVVLILFILLVILVLLIRIRRVPTTESKTPGQVESAMIEENGDRLHCKPVPESGPVSAPVTEAGIDDTKPNSDIRPACNPLQKPPRMTELTYPLVLHASTSTGQPSTGPANNPDLIRDTRRLASGETLLVPRLPSAKMSVPPMTSTSSMSPERPVSGEYNRVLDADSLYPSGLWDRPPPPLPPTTVHSPDLYIRRSTSARFHLDASDKTPIIGDGASMGAASEDEMEFSCRTFPRVATNHHQEYPNDYGLPILNTGVDEKLREVGVNPGPANGATASANSAKTLRVWQRGVPVLPPVTALKRVLSSNRNSPDEGFQEGCGTDV